MKTKTKEELIKAIEILSLPDLLQVLSFANAFINKKHKK